MLATAGLQMSQPRPLPCFASTSSKVLSSPTRTRWNSSWREYGKCSHRWLFTLTPRFFSSALSICVTSGAQPPQEVPALVLALSAPTVVQPASMARTDAPLETLLQEQICAESGSAASALVGGAPAPAAAAGKSNVSGFSGRAIALRVVCGSVP